MKQAPPLGTLIGCYALVDCKAMLLYSTRKRKFYGALIMNFMEYYSNLGFKKYPFSVFTSEAETSILEDIYVKMPNHSVILEACSKSSCIITGERGTGKTALSLDIERSLLSPSNLLIRIDEFSDLQENYSTEDLYQFFIERIACAFFLKYTDNPVKLWKYSKDERFDLSYYFHRYVGATSKSRLNDKISLLQNGKVKRAAVGTYNVCRGVLNYGLKALTQVASDTLTKHFSSLPQIDTGNPDYFKKIENEIDDKFTPSQREFYYLEKLIKLIKKSDVKEIFIAIDKIDEDVRFENDADKIGEYIRGIASDNKILTSNLFNVTLFSWSTPFNNIKDTVRTQKIAHHNLVWSKKQLEETLIQRLNVYSEGKIRNLEQILDISEPRVREAIFEMCNSNPRDLWHIFNHAFQQQHEIDPTKKIGDEAVISAIRAFVTGFNYYEYYPKKANARANTMDIYKYIKHLQKLDSHTFTKDKLNTVAGTGGSTNNYVVAMENMGLIKNTNEKAHGGAVVYEIVDPKVRYAMKHGIAIGN
jgi:hypothetical protein